MISIVSSSPDIQFGYGRHGMNVRHFVPSPEQIATACAEIREHGFTDTLGRWHAPWDDMEYRVRRSGRLVQPYVDVTRWPGATG